MDIHYLPIIRLLRATFCEPLVYSISTVMGAEYVRSLKRHSWGVVDLVILNPSSISGMPTYMFKYLKQALNVLKELNK
jgi:hypothetical protein